MGLLHCNISHPDTYLSLPPPKLPHLSVFFHKMELYCSFGEARWDEASRKPAAINVWNKFFTATCGADTQIIKQGASERAQRADEACAAATEQKPFSGVTSVMTQWLTFTSLFKASFCFQYKLRSIDTTFGTMLIQFMVTLYLKPV